MTSPTLVHLLRALERRLPARLRQVYRLLGSGSIGYGNLDLIPLHQLEHIPGRPGDWWNATGADPQFLLCPHDALTGWHRAELCVQSEVKRSVAKFYFDTGIGFNETEVLAFSYASGEMVDRVFPIDKPIRAIRFDPKEAKAAFRIEVLRLTPISEGEALTSMATRLSRHHEEYEGMRVDEVMVQVGKRARAEKLTLALCLGKAYAETFQVRPVSIDYDEWIDTVERKSLPDPQALTKELNRLALQPVISVVVPVFDTPEAYLRACIESVLAQSYPHWELCIADDASSRPSVRRVLDEYSRRDSRIRVVYRDTNGNISRASNTALEMARGDYVALLDHDDALAKHALYFMACAINAQPDAQILYSDEDKIDRRGKRFEPHFKSDWNPDLFFSQNYVSHLGLYRRELLRRIGGFRTGVEGSQDHDLLLRCLPHVPQGGIVHVPRVLYHWRSVEGSAALASSEKGYTTIAGMKALRDYFASTGKDVTVESLIPNTYRVRHAIPEPRPLVTLLIPTRDMTRILEVCVRSILERTTYKKYEILIIDNASSDPTTLAFFDKIRGEDKRVRVLPYPHPFNFSAINNFGVRHARGSIVGLVNNDVEVIGGDWLTEMVSHACRSEIGCVGAKLYYADDTLQHGGVIIGLGGVAGHSHKRFPRKHLGYFGRLVLTQNLSAVTAACLLVRKQVYEEVGGLDEENLKVAFNDVDFCLRVRDAGYRNLWTPYAELYHHESVSRGLEDSPEKIARFRGEAAYMQEKWGDALTTDPFYSPNLTREGEGFSM